MFCVYNRNMKTLPNIVKTPSPAGINTMKSASLPTLYSLNSNGSVQTWTISVTDNVITKTYGQTGGKIQKSTDIIENGKNIGKSNETSPAEQAVVEAKAQWSKKLKSGYVIDKNTAASGGVDSCIAGGVEPMLAHKFKDQGHKIVFPAYAQPKLDGIRCVAVIVDGVATLWTRTRKPITGVPHIIKDLESKFSDTTITFDGELYNHAYKNKFEEIVSFVRQATPKAGHEVVQYHVYDIVDTTKTFEERNDMLDDLRKSVLQLPFLVFVETFRVKTDTALMTMFTDWRKMGYEGAMVRNAASLYENKRSYGLQKIKEFDEQECEIIGVKSGRGRMSECAIFTCHIGGLEFDCKMEGSLDVLKEILQNPSLVLGKLLTVRHQGFTNGNLPRFPIGVCVRDYE